MDYDLIRSPEEVVKGYIDGSITGVYGDPRDLYDLIAGEGSLDFATTARDLVESGAGKLSLPFKAALLLDSEFGGYEAQKTGDCVSHSTRNAGMVDYAIDAQKGKTQWKGRFATENIYGWRGHGGQGASCARLAGYVSVNGIGGFLPRTRYSSGNNSVDLSTYNASIGHNWGRPGTPSWLNSIAKECPAESVAQVRSIEAARDALSNGYAVSVCSSFGFSNRRNQYGVSPRSGSWAHAMAWIAVNDDHNDPAYKANNGMLFLVQNSWGRNWNGGPKYHGQPDGSFWITASVARSMLSGGGGFIISRVKGFQRRDLEYLLI